MTSRTCAHDWIRPGERPVGGRAGRHRPHRGSCHCATPLSLRHGQDGLRDARADRRLCERRAVRYASTSAARACWIELMGVRHAALRMPVSCVPCRAAAGPRRSLYAEYGGGMYGHQRLRSPSLANPLGGWYPCRVGRPRGRAGCWAVPEARRPPLWRRVSSHQ